MHLASRTVFRAGDHPFPFAVESNSCNISGVAFECKYGGWVRGLDLVELDGVVACGGEEALIGCYA